MDAALISKIKRKSTEANSAKSQLSVKEEACINGKHNSAA
jgi:hypothetical protein